jgi:dolichyl-phosphate-mannose-protein mannosyltransferase
MHEGPRSSPGVKRWLPFAAIAAGYVVVGLTVGLWHQPEGDEFRFHQPAALQFARQFPRFDLVHYSSASGPVPYILLSLWIKVFGGTLVSLRVAVALCGLIALFTLWRLLARESLWTMTATMLLIATNHYFLYHSFSLFTIVPALCFGLAGLFFFERWSERPERRGALIASTLMIAGAVLSRQLYLSYAVALVACAALAKLGFQKTPGLPARSPTWAELSILLIPLALLAGLFALWGGTTPPGFAQPFDSKLGHSAIVLRQLDFMPLYLGCWFWPLAVENARKLVRWLPAAAGLLVLHVLRGPLQIVSPGSDTMGTIAKLCSDLYRHGIPLGVLQASEALLWGIGILVLIVLLRAAELPYRLVSIAHLGVLATIPQIFERFYMPFYVAFWLGMRHQLRTRWLYVAMILQSSAVTVAYFVTHP